MDKTPELIIGYDENYLPTNAICSACGERMPTEAPTSATSSNFIKQLKAEFDLHVDNCHEPRYVN